MGKSTFAGKAVTAGVGIPVVDATSDDGVSYAATVPGVTELYTGLTIIIVAKTVSKSTSATLNVNGLGAKKIYQKSSNISGGVVAPDSDNWMSNGHAIQVRYNGSFWVADITPIVAQDIEGQVSVTNGGTGRSHVKPGYYLVGNGTRAMTEMSPGEVLSNIGAKAATERDVFIAEYGVTTSAEIHAAIIAGKAVFCKKNNCPLCTEVNATTHTFVSAVERLIVLRCSSDVWQQDDMNYPPIYHATTHKSTGPDPITPDMIGAASKTYVDDSISTAIGNIETLLSAI